MRTEAAFDWNGVLSPANIRVDAWVTPPVYTGKPPIILSAANKEAAIPASGPLPVPAGSTLIVRSSGGTLDVLVERRRHRSRADRSRRRRAPTNGTSPSPATAPPMSARPPASRNGSSAAIPDRPPTIALAKDPERQARGSLQMSYKLEDDYGVTEAQAHFAARPAEAREGRRGAAAAVRPAAICAGAARMRGPATASARR